jgi:5-methyltetrahydrofolate--homocysteine methyltransferase
LATVKGDVHDIGKNLVEIILSNNGYEVVNLGIKVPPEELIAAALRERPDFIGLSGLLVKSAQQMAITAADLKAAGIDVPLMVGGAALSKKFADTRIAPAYGGPVLYAKEAMSGLDLANRLSDPALRPELLRNVAEQQESAMQAPVRAVATDPPGGAVRSAVRTDVPLPSPPDFTTHLLREIPLAHVLPYLNRQMLYSKHLGLTGVVERLLAAGDDKAVKVHEAVEAMLVEAREQRLIRPHAIYRFFPAAGDGNDLVLFDPDGSGSEITRFTFPRQAGGERLCLPDFARPLSSGVRDSVALFVVTCGERIREQAERLKEAGDYLKSHILQALALELAEATAEYLHKRVRDAWGISDDPALTMKQLFNAEYQGIRVSFGYPACPEIADQEKLFALLRPEQIGVQLTEEFMMDPEASVSALVFHHPEGKYFAV